VTEADQRMRLVIKSYCYGCHGKRFDHNSDARQSHFRLWRYEIWAGSGDRRMAVYRRVEFRSWERAWISACKAWPQVKRALYDERES
jgi:hypothetical protein